MRTQAWRRDPAAYTDILETSARYTDLDRWQHLNNAAAIGLHGEAIQRWLIAHQGAEAWRQRSPALVLKASRTDFLAEAHYPAPLQQGVRLLHADDHMLHLAAAMFQGGHCVGLHDAWVGAWQDGAARPLPAGLAGLRPPRLAPLPSQAAEPDAPEPGMPAAPEALPLADAAPTLNQLPWQADLPTRFGDADAQGHASDLSLARLAEQMRVQCLHQITADLHAPDAPGFMVAHVALRWLRRAGPPAVWRGGMRAARIGERAITLQAALYDGADGHALCESVLVCIDHGSRRSTALPPDVRAAFQRLR